MGSGRFAYLICPQERTDFRPWLSPLARLPLPVLEPVFRIISPVVLAEFRPVISSRNRASGWLIGVPVTPRQLVSLPIKQVQAKVAAAFRLVRRLGADVLGLDGPLGMVQHDFEELGQSLDIAITNGNTYTVSTALEGTLARLKAAKIDPGQAHFAVLGTDDKFGGQLACLLARPRWGVRRLTIAGRRTFALRHLSQSILADTGLVVETASAPNNLAAAVDVLFNFDRDAARVDVRRFRPGTIICDVLPPYVLARRLHRRRPDVHVLTGGLTAVPGTSLQLQRLIAGGSREAPATIKLISATLAETILLALARYDASSFNGSHSRRAVFAQAERLWRFAQRHGFRTVTWRPVRYSDFTGGGDG